MCSIMSFTHRFGNATPDDDYDLICDLCTRECDGYPCRVIYRGTLYEDVALIEALRIEDKLLNR